MRKIIVGIVLILLLTTTFYLTKLRDFWQAVYTPAHFSQQNGDDKLKEKTDYTVLLLGYAGGERPGGYLTDTMILARINIKDNIVLLISIPRDLWVQVPVSKGKRANKKVNTAYSIGISDRSYPNKEEKFTGPSGGGAMVKHVVGNILGTSLDYYVALDFDGFVDAVDAIGGVILELKKPLDDPEYPLEGHEEDLCGQSEDYLVDIKNKLATMSANEVFPCRYEHLFIPGGQRHFDGTAALKLVRSRHAINDSGDFSRADRQQQFLLAIKDKVLQLSFIPKIPGLAESLEEKFRTDIPYDLITKLLSERDQLASYKVTNLVLSDQNFLRSDYSSDGQYILLPEAGEGNWEQIRRWVNVLTDASQDAHPTIKVKNATNIEGLGSTAVARLRGKGLNVVEPENSIKTQPITNSQIVVYNIHVKRMILDQLKSEFGVVPEIATDERDFDDDIVITLGEDYNKKLQ